MPCRESRCDEAVVWKRHSAGFAGHISKSALSAPAGARRATRRLSSSMVSALSDGSILFVGCATGGGSLRVARAAGDLFGPLRGVTFGSANPRNDRVFSGNAGVRALISIDGRPFLAAIQRAGAQIFFIGAADVVDLDAEADNSVPMEYFSTFVVQSMVLRSVFGDECWRP